ncbi:hypothetical protein SAMN05421505_14923 [Sinosporangium album]|uniref:Uncharacterized protein n=1 Tax=Sinosporangium album TaxID=504805 RepID=A0A1G8KBS2_9ACTN|nr:hypothetical protein [Sinosporangium album]SDI40884.1 hypothetical protein SAMN05421505_14923 [Sinosporangium album]
MPDYRDRNNGYVPEKLFLSRRPHLAEIGFRKDPETGHKAPLKARVAHGLADELNRESHWQWADVFGDGTHWSRFQGHRVQIDVTFRTENRREVNDWKGRDEIRAGGEWTLALNRQQCWEGFIHPDPLATLRTIPRIIEQLLDHSLIDWLDEKPAAEQLLGRRVYYEHTPAVVSSTSVLPEGCVMLKPVGAEFFPPAVYDLDEGDDGDQGERRAYKVDLLSPHVWWWRKKSYGGEPTRTA